MKKNILTICFLLVAFVSIGQQQTAYEKKYYSLTIQFFRKLGVDESLLTKANKLSDLEGFFLFSDILKKLNTEKGLMLMLAYEREIKEAASLKTSIDFEREKEKKEKKEREAKQKQLEYDKMQAKLAKERLEKERIERLNNSDFILIKSKVVERFNKWLTKGEFEKTADYESRIRNSCLQNFQQINYETVLERINNYDLELTLKEYDADKECFKVDIKFKDLKWTDSVKVSIAKAEEFKDNFSINNEQTIYQNWGIFDNQLYPQKFIIIESTSKKNYEFTLPINKLEEYKISTSDLGINNPNFDKLEFSFFDYKSKKDKELEDVKEKESKRLEFKDSDLDKLHISIKEKFEAWLLKGNFETDKDYEARIKTQGDAKFINIKEAELEKIYRTARSSYVKEMGKLGIYDINNEKFPLFCTYFNRTCDTLYLRVPKELASNFNSTFSKKNILIYPTKTIIVNNKIKILNVLVIFNNHWLGDSNKYLTIGPVSKTNTGYLYNGSINMIDINSVLKQSSYSFTDGIYYLEYNSDKSFIDQTLDISYQTLNISLPKF